MEKRKRGRPKKEVHAPKIAHLDSMGGVVRELATLYREGRQGKLDLVKMQRLASVLTMLRSALEGIQIEELLGRIAEMEAYLDAKGTINGFSSLKQIEARIIEPEDRRTGEPN